MHKIVMDSNGATHRIVTRFMGITCFVGHAFAGMRSRDAPLAVA